MREEYRLKGLEERNCETNPIVQFERWIKDAQAAHLKEPNAMTLATVGAGGRPSARIVLLKEVSDLGFVFYTNYSSRKARELEANPFVALTFYWTELERQVRVEGRVERISREQSEGYFQTRPRGSRLGAWASHQSQVVSNRAEMDAGLEEMERRYGSGDVPAPEFWGGYCVVHEAVEFWQGRPNRMHDRLLYRRKDEDAWTIERLWP
ncbi:MAG: pyridoxamine 5'-phosphate oxidase [Acidobacteriaceae bacterium]|nr:pyridoxamine 5'-phosphate oxidase [Acidobacteriaceae bacterium]